MPPALTVAGVGEMLSPTITVLVRLKVAFELTPETEAVTL
jgi:hypothetical protein